MIVLAYSFMAMLSLGIITWLMSIHLKDVSIVDSIWSMMFLLGGVVYAQYVPENNQRALLILCMLLIWSLRLTGYLTWRNWGESEDRRYQRIRAKYQPHFAIKSLVIIFVFQAVLAWVISLPLWPALTQKSYTAWDLLAVILWLVGMFFESIGDWQLSQFRKDPSNQGKVMDKGLWRYTRHPNYFGECLIWWGFFAFALSAGAWWTIISPLLITWLLLKFSGVVMLEETITERRPAYRDYIARTNAFLPGRPKPASMTNTGEEQFQ